MLPGLFTSTTVTVLMCASVFQRRSRSGFLDDLESVRGEALTAPRSEMATAVALADAAVAEERRAGDDVEPAWAGWPGDDDLPDHLVDELAEDLWAQPTPHPIRPHEMWHPGSTPAPLVRTADNVGPTPEGGAAADETEATDHETASFDSTVGVDEAGPTTRRRFARFRPADQAPAPEVPLIPDPDACGLLGGPVRRRERSGRERRPLAAAPSLLAPADGVEQQAEAEAPLPPAALVVDDRSELVLGATVIRFGEETAPGLQHGEHGPVVDLTAGSAWVTGRGDASPVPVRICLPHGHLVVTAGGCALAVVEADRSCFVAVLDGSAELTGSGPASALDAGSLVLVTPTGDVQVDRADRSELEADPLVARNLELDAAG